MKEQLTRLLSQLEDLDELKDEMDAKEYAATRADTVAQLREFDGQLKRLAAGDVGLVSKIASLQLGIQAAVSAAFKPEVIRLFVDGESGALRQVRCGDNPLTMRTLCCTQRWMRCATAVVRWLTALVRAFHPHACTQKL